MTPLELIDDTIAYYSDRTKRGVADGEQCQYLTRDGKMCAVGRWIDWDRVGVDRAREFNSIGSVYKETEQIFEALKEEVKDIPKGLWEELQRYHDYTLSDNAQCDVEKDERELRERWNKK